MTTPKPSNQCLLDLLESPPEMKLEPNNGPAPVLTRKLLGDWVKTILGRDVSTIELVTPVNGIVAAKVGFYLTENDILELCKYATRKKDDQESKP